MNIAIVGTGKMGGTLGRLLAVKGHDVAFISRDPEGRRRQAGPVATYLPYGAPLGSFDAVVLATPWATTEAASARLGDVAGKTVIDITNPLSADISHLVVGGDRSAGEAVAGWLPGAQVVKAFNTVHSDNLARPSLRGRAVQMFLCGDDAAAKATTADLVRDLGFEAVDCGPLSNARYTEALAMLWIQMAFVEGAGPDLAFRVEAG